MKYPDVINLRASKLQKVSFLYRFDGRWDEGCGSEDIRSLRFLTIDI